MLFEELLILLMGLAAVFLIGIPIYRFVKVALPARKDPVKDAKERLEQAKIELEAARLNKEAEKLYAQMYEETLEDEGNATGEQKKGKER